MDTGVLHHDHLPRVIGVQSKTDTPGWWNSLAFCTKYVACGATTADTIHQCCRRQGCTPDTPFPLYPTRTFLLHVLAWRGTQTELHIWEDSRLCPARGPMPHNPGPRVGALPSNEHTPRAHFMTWNRTQSYTYHPERVPHLSKPFHRMPYPRPVVSPASYLGRTHTLDGPAGVRPV